MSITSRYTPRPRAALAVALLAAVALLPGCIGLFIGTTVDTVLGAAFYPVHEWVFLGSYKYDNDPGDPWVELENDEGRDYGEELVGIAVSGGGSRSALFLACALDEMRKYPSPDGTPGRSLIDEIDFISSVSGGSLSSAYYVLKRPADRAPAAQDAFFAQYRADMQKNFEMRSLGRLLFLFRWVPMTLTYYDRARLMAGCWDANFFDGKTFADLPHPKDGAPTLLVNAASYSTGQKFVFSRVPASRLDKSGIGQWLREKGQLGTDAAYRAFGTRGFDSLNCTIGSYPLSVGVVASASVPGLLGPVVVKSGIPGGGFETLGDGGLYDNYGVETLAQLFTVILDEHPGMKARIIVVDGAGFFPEIREHLNWALGDYTDRSTSISWFRASGLTRLLLSVVPHAVPRDVPDPSGDGTYRIWEVGEAEESPYRNLRFQLVSLYHKRSAEEIRREAERQSGIGAVLRGKPVTDAFKTFNSRVRGIGTRLKISEEDASFVESQARASVRTIIGGDVFADPRKRTVPVVEPPPPSPPRSPEEGGAPR